MNIRLVNDHIGSNEVQREKSMEQKIIRQTPGHAIIFFSVQTAHIPNE